MVIFNVMPAAVAADCAALRRGRWNVICLRLRAMRRRSILETQEGVREETMLSRMGRVNEEPVEAETRTSVSNDFQSGR